MCKKNNKKIKKVLTNIIVCSIILEYRKYSNIAQHKK